MQRPCNSAPTGSVVIEFISRHNICKTNREINEINKSLYKFDGSTLYLMDSNIRHDEYSYCRRLTLVPTYEYVDSWNARKRTLAEAKETTETSWRVE